MCLRMNLIDTLDNYVAIRPSAGLSVYSDDLSTHTYGRKERVRKVEAETSLCLLIEMLQAPPPTGVGFMVAADQGHVVAPDPKIATLICSDLRAMGIKSTGDRRSDSLGSTSRGAGSQGVSPATSGSLRSRGEPLN